MGIFKTQENVKPSKKFTDWTFIFIQNLISCPLVSRSEANKTCFLLVSMCLERKVFNKEEKGRKGKEGRKEEGRGRKKEGKKGKEREKKKRKKENTYSEQRVFSVSLDPQLFKSLVSFSVRNTDWHLLNVCSHTFRFFFFHFSSSWIYCFKLLYLLFSSFWNNISFLR